MASPYALRRPVENTFLVRQRDRRLLRELAGVLLAVTVVGVGLLLYTWTHVEILRTGYRVDHLQRDLHQLLERERQLKLETAWRSHPAEIERRARTELGLTRPALAQTLHYEELGSFPAPAAEARP